MSGRWAPVNRISYSEFLHALADDEASEVSRGHVVPRSLPLPRTDAVKDNLGSQLHAIRAQVVVERRMLADPLSRWAQFLASPGDNEQALRHSATIAWQLDLVRDAPL